MGGDFIDNDDHDQAPALCHPDAGRLHHSDLPDSDLPDSDLPDWEIPDWDLPDWDLPDSEYRSHTTE